MGTMNSRHVGSGTAKAMWLNSAASGTGVGGARQLEVSLKGIGQAQAELQTVWVKIAPNTSWCAALLRTVHQQAGSGCKSSEQPDRAPRMGDSSAVVLTLLLLRLMPSSMMRKV